MKLYNHSEASETLAGILSVYPTRTLAENLAILMVKYADKNNGWKISDCDLSIRKQEEDKFSIKIGNEE
jgi:dolichyl-phosphate-mannose--protein O-mannosyl transferase